MKKVSGKTRTNLRSDNETNEIIALAEERAKQQILDGTASSQVITHYLKLGAAREKTALENKKLELELKLIEAKTEQIQSMADVTQAYEKAMKMMTEYQGNDDPEEDDEDEY